MFNDSSPCKLSEEVIIQRWFISPLTSQYDDVF
jgi:hypothetical protein